MSERVETVRLIAEISNYVAGMEKMRQSTAKATESAEAKLERQKKAFNEVGRAALAVGAIAATAVGLAVARFAEFDQAMSNVKAVTQETTGNMRDLREAALDYGASSVFTATEAANAIEELGKAGLSTADILEGGLGGALDLASAGELGIARAAEIAATTLQQFGLAGDQASRVADTLAAGAGKALGSVEDLANGLKFVGPVAASMGVSLEETTGVLAMFAQQGIIGEQAGTSLRGMLSSLTSPSSIARKELDALGISLYDSTGAFLGLENAAGQMANAYKGMTDEQRDASLGMIFGNQQVTAARVFYQQGADGVREWTDAVNDSGYAAQVARDRLDNLRGDVEQLGGALDTFLIKSGSGANDILRTMVQTLTFLVDGVGQLPDPMLHAGLAIGVVTAAIALSGGAALIAIPKYLELTTAMSRLGLTMGGVAAKAALVGGAIGAATLIIGYFAAKQAEAAAMTDELADTLDEATGAFTEYTRASIAKRLADSGAFDVTTALGISQKELTDALLEGGEALDLIKQKVTDKNNIIDFFNGSGIAAGNASATIRELQSNLAASQKEWEHNKAAMEGSEKATDKNAEALAGLRGAAGAADKAISDLAAEIRGFGSATLDAREAERQFQAAIDDATATLAENGATLDINTEAGRANESALDDIATSALEAAAAIYDKTQSEEAATAAVTAGRAALMLQLEALGITGEAAEAYADNLGLIPSNITTAVALVGLEAAQNALNSFVLDNNGRTIAINVANSRNYADGGPITGSGGPRQDNIPIMASVGEHMLDAEDVQRMGGHAGVFAFRRSLYQGFADGGPVYMPAAQQPTLVGASASVSAPSFEVVLSQKGGVDLLRYVDVAIREKDRDAQMVTRGGRIQ